jgi:hypothetical protein
VFTGAVQKIYRPADDSFCQIAANPVPWNWSVTKRQIELELYRIQRRARIGSLINENRLVA